MILAWELRPRPLIRRVIQLWRTRIIHVWRATGTRDMKFAQYTSLSYAEFTERRKWRLAFGAVIAGELRVERRSIVAGGFNFESARGLFDVDDVIGGGGLGWCLIEKMRLMVYVCRIDLNLSFILIQSM